MSKAVIIALDWGTSNARAWLLDRDGNALDERRGESGVGKLDKAGFEARFDALTKGWPDLPALACGMVGSRQGWYEADYGSLPISIDELSAGLLRFKHGGRDIAIIPGIKKDLLDAHDVMRGEETQIAGLLSMRSDYSGTVLLPGTHSKWVRLRDGKAVDFRTYMTGELFSVFSKNTILRHSVVEQRGSDDEEALNNTFTVAVGDVFTAKGSDWGRFFGLRAASLLVGDHPAETFERLSGLLIGMELASAAQDGFDIQDVAIIGEGGLLERYGRAFDMVAASVEAFDGAQVLRPAFVSIARAAGLIKE
ncbi:MAG: 2-dehydro-3-deoxygalactonokinase [Ahrensia sp.]|nr:2-dehydro-3-deoxygalactonokinase [Ahrensia sp.]